MQVNGIFKLKMRHNLRFHIIGDRRNSYFHFKALKKTNKAVTLKFSFGRFWKESKYQRIETFKINVK